MNDDQLIRYERHVHDTGYRMGFHDGYKAVLPILADLIAELVGDDGDGHEITEDGQHGCTVCTSIDRAEARLKGLTDE